MPNILMVIAPDQFRDEEYAHPRDVLEGRGATVVTASVAPGPCRGKLGMLARADVAVREASAASYQALLFIGGAGAAVFFDDRDAHRLAQRILADGGVVGAICVAPSILARAGILDGRRATSFPSQREDLESHGARYVASPVVTDDLIITANGPDAAREFGVAVADALGI